MHILDIAQNSLTAKCSLLEIEVDEDIPKNRLVIIIRDNGCGMSEEMVRRVSDPFTTTRTTRKVGMGIPLFKEAAESAGGSFTIESQLGVGTTVCAKFQYDHIDRQPLGNMADTLPIIIGNCENADLVYIHRVNERRFVLDTREIRNILGEEIALSAPDVMAWIRDYVKEGEAELNKTGGNRP